MPVINTNDSGLRRLTYEHSLVLAKFTSDKDCSACEQLAPHFAGFASDPAYAGIVFLRLNSDENPVARHMMNTRSAPFFVSYCEGRMLECDTRLTDGEMRAQLQRLQQHCRAKVA